ncbi:MAG: ABC transporter substrate-binding protein [Ramlibacter sp.]|nr:ABC transporter substrate-binding protein [Cryobacterium sp.]
MRRRSSAPLIRLTIALCGILVLSGCAGTVVRSAPTPAPTSQAATPPTGDGTVRIGTLFAMTGDGSALGAAQVAGSELAAREIIEQGLVLGTPIELVHRNSAGDLPAALADLLARGVDVVLWDAGSPVPAEVASATKSARVALLALGEFANGGTPLAADEVFAARLRTMDPGLTDTAGGGESYDGVVLTALAATQADDDGGTSVAPAFERVSSGPVTCSTWGECAVALADAQQIAYEGVTGRRS